jgi:predicted NUDIX family NTP pyrophosphohydrolase
MAKQSAGILLFRRKEETEVFLVHPGGPFYARKDPGVWSIPKGEFDSGEQALDAAKREFEEETGKKPEGNFIPLNPVTQKAGKVVHAWAVEGDLDADAIVSNTFQMEWPPKSGKMKEFPENDRAGWFTFDQAQEKINAKQIELLDQLRLLLQ